MELNSFYKEILSNYEKTILRLAISQGIMGIYHLDDNDIIDLSDLLNIDYYKLKKALFISDRDVRHFTTIKTDDNIYKVDHHLDYVFFDIIIRYSFIRKTLSKISDHIDKEHLKSNIELFESILHNFEIINAQSATFEYMHNDSISSHYAIYSSSDFAPSYDINLLKISLVDDEFYIQNKNILPIIYHMLSYEFYTRTNTLYLISITQILKHSPFYDENFHNIADYFYFHLLFMLRDARIISVQVNLLYNDLNKASSLRNRKADNTTRLQILYGYDNYDAYSIRLDLSHQGEWLVHYNNKSPGGIRCCLFSESEYKALSQANPALIKFFIKYGNRWALKEFVNCEMDSDEKRQYESIRKSKEHDPAFSETYTEENIVFFINILGNMLPRYCYVPIDKEEIHAKYCFNYDKIMGGVCCLYLAYLSSDTKGFERVMDFIVSRAINYKLINESEKETYSCIEGICLIAEYAKERAFIFV